MAALSAGELFLLTKRQPDTIKENVNVRVHERDRVEQQAHNISLDQSSPSIQDCVQFKAETICQQTKLNMQCFSLLCTEAKHHALMSISAPKFFFFFFKLIWSIGCNTLVNH